MLSRVNRHASHTHGSTDGEIECRGNCLTSRIAHAVASASCIPKRALASLASHSELRALPFASSGASGMLCDADAATFAALLVLLPRRTPEL
eukprot:607666-Rhodomonas_salina.1